LFFFVFYPSRWRVDISHSLSRWRWNSGDDVQLIRAIPDAIDAPLLGIHR